MTKKILFVSMVIAALGGQSSLVFGQTAPMTVEATVTESCDLTVPTLTIASYTSTTDTATEVSGDIDVTCTSGTAYSIDIDLGNNSASAGTTSRAMVDVGATNFLDYELYQPDGTTVWGSTATGAGGAALSGTTGTGSSQTYSVTASVPAGQGDVPAGTYSDQVDVTVTIN